MSAPLYRIALYRAADGSIPYLTWLRDLKDVGGQARARARIKLLDNPGIDADAPTCAKGESDRDPGKSDQYKRPQSKRRKSNWNRACAGQRNHTFHLRRAGKR